MTIWLEFNRKVACPEYFKEGNVFIDNIDFDPPINKAFYIINEEGYSVFDNFGWGGFSKVKYDVSDRWYCVVLIDKGSLFYDDCIHTLNKFDIHEMGIYYNVEEGCYREISFSDVEYEISYDFFVEDMDFINDDGKFRAGDDVEIKVKFNSPVDISTIDENSCKLCNNNNDEIKGINITAKRNEEDPERIINIKFTLPNENLNIGDYNFKIKNAVKSEYDSAVWKDRKNSIILHITNAQDSGDLDVPTDDYNPNKPTKEDVGKAFDMAGKVLGVIINVGIILTVIMITVIGLKFMLSSPSEKAEYMKSALPLIVGAVLLVSSVGIVKLIASSIGD